jgi:hypothetical protein
MDPIGTIRREDHRDDGEGPGYSIWLRMQPTYPDDQLPDTEWTCLWSTSPGNIGSRLGDDIVKHSEIIGQVPGTPAYTGADVEQGDHVRLREADVVGRVSTFHEINRWRDQRLFFVTVATSSGPVDVGEFRRQDFDLLETVFNEPPED